MTNRVDFYQGEYKALAIPAARCEVFLEGAVCPFLEVTEIVREDWPNFGQARLRYNPAAVEAAMGKSIAICRLINIGIGEVRIEPVCIFTGHVEQIETKLEPKEQGLEITARDFSARLDRETVGGRRVATTGGESLFNSGLGCVFNEGGQPNASKQQIQHNGANYTVFAGDGQEAKYWSSAEVLEYLLSEYVVFGQLQVPPAGYLEAITKGALVDELDVEGKSVLNAVQDCSGQAGLKFTFRPRQKEVGPREQIVFYRLGQRPSVELNLQYAREKLSVSRTNVCELESEKRYQTADSGIIETIDVRTPIVAMHYEVGDRVTTSPDSRDILGVRRDNRSIFWIDRIKMDFENQCTNLRILRTRAFE